MIRAKCIKQGGLKFPPITDTEVVAVGETYEEVTQKLVDLFSKKLNQSIISSVYHSSSAYYIIHLVNSLSLVPPSPYPTASRTTYFSVYFSLEIDEYSRKEMEEHERECEREEQAIKEEEEWMARHFDDDDEPDAATRYAEQYLRDYHSWIGGMLLERNLKDMLTEIIVDIYKKLNYVN